MDEDILQQLQQLQAQNESLKAEVDTLSRTKSGLLADLGKLKGAKRLLVAAGIDPEADEDQIASSLAAVRRQPAPVDRQPGQADYQATRAHEQASAASQRPPGEQPAGDSVADATTRAQLDSMIRQINDLQERLNTTEQEKQTERQLRQRDKARAQAMQIMEEANVKPRQKKNLLDLLEIRNMITYSVEEAQDGTDLDPIVLFGDNENPKTFKDGLLQISQEEDFEAFFSNTSPSGSGLPTSRSVVGGNSFGGAASVANPFMTPGNATQASLLYQRDPRQAKRQYDQAKAAGKLDRVVAKVIEGAGRT